ncbi:hypothetical protein PMAYCL1PPCAC_03774 [Pristionchus mayeri]|uniref:Uncharacterized protein n=1 Tax=Pristionchus mayeri TaxID=1317129 RepID=A0AAN4Z596_9BILA|nr:hypothetical protein PMAYCL1PPCAC_03774 [Pristionchus mayeri]
MMLFGAAACLLPIPFLAMGFIAFRKKIIALAFFFSICSFFLLVLTCMFWSSVICLLLFDGNPSVFSGRQILNPEGLVYIPFCVVAIAYSLHVNLYFLEVFWRMHEALVMSRKRGFSHVFAPSNCFE